MKRRTIKVFCLILSGSRGDSLGFLIVTTPEPTYENGETSTQTNTTPHIGLDIQHASQRVNIDRFTKL